jgi:hypothetical protein
MTSARALGTAVAAASFIWWTGVATSATAAAPVVTLVGLSEGQTISGGLQLEARVQSDSAVSRVEFAVDGALVATERYGPYCLAGDGGALPCSRWDTRKVADGTRVFVATAYDSAGRAGRASVAVQVLNAPSPVTLVGPSQGQTVSGGLRLEARVAASGVARVEFAVDGALVATERSGPYCLGGDPGALPCNPWDTRRVADGSRVFRATAYGSSGVLGQASLTLVVRNAAAPSPTPPGLGWPGASDGAGATRLVLGGAGDYAGALRLGQNGWTGEGTSPTTYGWGPEVAYERPGDPEGFFPYRLPAGAGEGWLRARMIKNAYPAHVVIPVGTRYVGLEWKDLLVDPSATSRFVPAEVNGPRLRLGDRVVCELPRTSTFGAMSALWRRTVCDLGAPVAAEAVLTLGGGTYGANEFAGQMLVHALIASPAPIPARAPVRGYWPEAADLMPAGDWRDRQGRPFAPVLCNMSGSQKHTVDLAVWMGCDVVFPQVSPQGAGNRRYAGEPSQMVVAEPAFYQYTLPAQIAMARAAGLRWTPHPSDDIAWQYYITQLGRDLSWGGPGWAELFDGTWRGSRRVLDKRLSELVAPYPAEVPFVFLRDESDHESQWWGSFFEQVREHRARANRLAPRVPTFNLVQGWKHGMHETCFALADVCATDHYPSAAELPKVYEFAQNLKRAAGARAFVMVTATSNQYEWPVTDPAKMNDAAYQRAAVYYGLVSGARGHWLHGDYCRIETTVDDPATPANEAWCYNYYRSLKPVTDEVHALADVIHASAALLGETVAESQFTGGYLTAYRATGDGTSANPKVATRFVRAPTRRVLLAVSVAPTAAPARLRVASLRAGDRIQVLFENRTVTADQDGSFVDTFAPFQRHVYRIP